MRQEIYLPSIMNDLSKIGVPIEGIWGEVSGVSAKFSKLDQILKHAFEQSGFKQKERMNGSDQRVTLYEDGGEAVIIQRERLNPDGTWADHKLLGYGPAEKLKLLFDETANYYRNQCSFTVERT